MAWREIEKVFPVVFFSFWKMGDWYAPLRFWLFEISHTGHSNVRFSRSGLSGATIARFRAYGLSITVQGSDRRRRWLRDECQKTQAQKTQLFVSAH